MKKNLIIDGQILQTSAWYRGMGKYLLQVLRELNKNIPDDIELTLLFNSNLDCEPLRFQTVEFLCPGLTQIRRPLPITADTRAASKDYTKQLELLVDELFENGDNYYFITAPFYFDFFAEFPENCRKLILAYDLTPLLFWRDLGGYFPPKLYMQRFQRILDADNIFAISETTKQDVMKVFGLPPEKVVSINGGFTKIAESSSKPKKFDIPDEYILFPSGDLPHKNNEVAIRGFEEYYKQAKNGLPLLITSHFHDQSKELLRAISSHIIFTGNVADEELEWLYQHAQAILFASKYEGLGMPILDAVANHKPIVTSRISVFEEMSKQAFYYFDPDNPLGLAEALAEATRHKDFPSRQKHYAGILQKYTWLSTCEGITAHLDNKPAEPEPESAIAPKSRIAIACLYPGIAHQIGRVAEALHFSLNQAFEVDYYFDTNGYHYREMERPTFLNFLENEIFDISKLTLHTYKRYDEVVYLLDAVMLPSRLAQRACVLPGIALTNFDGDKLSGQNKMLKELVLNNQFSAHRLQERSYAEYQKIAKLLRDDLVAMKAAPSAAMTIIRQSNFDHSIMEKLRRHDP